MKFMLFFLMALALGATEFRESRYIDALGINMNASGVMEFRDEQIILHYQRPKEKRLHFYDDRLVSYEEGVIRTQRYDRYVQFGYIYLLMHAVHNDEYSNLANYFEIEIDANARLLSPNESAREIFESIVIYKDEMVVIEILMQSGDRVKIESTL